MSLVKANEKGELVRNYPLIYSKMSKVMGEIGAIGKNSTNTAQGFKFRGIDAFVNALHPALLKHGVFMAPRVLERKEEIREVTRSNGKIGVDRYVSLLMSYTFYAEDGSSVTTTVPAEGLDSGDKATNKALSAALKYTLIQTFSVPTEDMAEADLDSPELGTAVKKQAEKPTADLNTSSETKSETTTPVQPAAKANGFRKPTKANGAVDDSKW